MDGTATIIAGLTSGISILFATLMKLQMDTIKRQQDNEDKHLNIIGDNNIATNKMADTQETMNDLLKDLLNGDLIYEVVCEALSDQLSSSSASGTVQPVPRRRRPLRRRRVVRSSASTRAPTT